MTTEGAGAEEEADLCRPLLYRLVLEQLAGSSAVGTSLSVTCFVLLLLGLSR